VTPKPIDVVVGARLSALRTVRRISLDRLCSVLGATENTISKYESGATRIPPDHLIKICRFFEVKLGDFFPRPDRNHDPNLN
jgi:transcriptional regulator with XRE-family HTH domain